MIEANNASSSANDVSISTWVFGCFARISPRRLDAAPVDQSDVHDDDVGAGTVGLVDRLLDGTRLGRHDDVVLRLQHRSDAVADDLVIVDEHHPEGRLLHDGMLARHRRCGVRIGPIAVGPAARAPPRPGRGSP